MYVIALNFSMELISNRIIFSAIFNISEIPSPYVGLRCLTLLPRITYHVNIILQLRMISGQYLARDYLMNQFGTEFGHCQAGFDKHDISGYINKDFQGLNMLIDELTKLIEDVNPPAGGQSLYD